MLATGTLLATFWALDSGRLGAAVLFARPLGGLPRGRGAGGAHDWAHRAPARGARGGRRSRCSRSGSSRCCSPSPSSGRASPAPPPTTASCTRTGAEAWGRWRSTCCAIPPGRGRVLLHSRRSRRLGAQAPLLAAHDGAAAVPAAARSGDAGGGLASAGRALPFRAQSAALAAVSVHRAGDAGVRDGRGARDGEPRVAGGGGRSAAASLARPGPARSLVPPCAAWRSPRPACAGCSTVRWCASAASICRGGGASLALGLRSRAAALTGIAWWRACRARAAWSRGSNIWRASPRARRCIPCTTSSPATTPIRPVATRCRTGSTPCWPTSATSGWRTT